MKKFKCSAPRKWHCYNCERLSSVEELNYIGPWGERTGNKTNINVPSKAPVVFSPERDPFFDGDGDGGVDGGQNGGQNGGVAAAVTFDAGEDEEFRYSDEEYESGTLYKHVFNNLKIYDFTQKSPRSTLNHKGSKKKPLQPYNESFSAKHEKTPS